MTIQQKPRFPDTAAQVWLKYGRDLNVRAAEHALAGIDDEMAHLREMHRDMCQVAGNQSDEIACLRAERDALLDALKGMVDLRRGAYDKARAAIKAVEG